MNMKTKSPTINVFTLLQHRKPIENKDNLAPEVDKLLNNIYSARKSIEYELLTSVYFYNQLLKWVDLINNKELDVKELLSRGSYTKSELKSKLGAFLLNLKAFQRYLTNPNETNREALYKSWCYFGFNGNKLNAIKESIINRKTQTTEDFFKKIVRLQAIINACSSRIVELYAPMAIERAHRMGIQYDDDNNIIEDHEDDLVQAGLMGLWIAAQHWEPNKDAAFSTYAWYWIGSEFAKYFNTKYLVALPRNLLSLRNTINKISFKFGISKSNISDFKKFLNHSDRRIEAAMTQEGCVSLNDIMNEEYQIEEKGLEFLTDKHDLIAEFGKVTNNEKISEILKRNLTPKEQKVIKMRYGFYNNTPCELSEIADEIGMSKESVRKVIKNSIIKIVPEIVKVFGDDYDELDSEKVLEMHR